MRCSVSPCDAATAPIDNSSQAPRGTLTLSPVPVKIDAPVEVQTIPQIWSKLASQHGSLTAVHDPHHSPVTKATYRELHQQMCAFAAGLKDLGLRSEQRVSLFAENSSRWLIADQGIMFNSAANAVRGSTTPCAEQAYILRHSRSSGLIIQDAASLQRLLPHILPANGDGGNAARGTDGNGSKNGSSPPASNRANASITADDDSVDTRKTKLDFVVLLWGDATSATTAGLDCPLLTFDQVVARGHGGAAEFETVAVPPDSLATLVYTSGTTGQPKGVMLSHSNLFYQLAGFDHFIAPHPGDTTLSLLPPWHIYERTTGYYIFSRACTQVYTTIKHFRDDLTKYPPSYFVCVPLVLDTLHSRVWQTIKRGSALKSALARLFVKISTRYVRACRVTQGMDIQYAVKPPSAAALLWSIVVAAVLAPLHWLAGRLVYGKIRVALGVRRAVVSGGGSLQPHIDDFFEAVGITVVNGWGLSETSPVLACRRDKAFANVRGTVGSAIPGTELRIVHPYTRVDLADGEQGVILARGPGVMKGYFDNPSATAAAFPEGEGWFDTGDLGWRAPQGVSGSRMGGCLVLTGRSKDTIVLASGENIEPAPLEDAICVSPYIKFATVIGQDCKHLGALLVPDLDALSDLAKEKGMKEVSDSEVAALLREEVTRATAKWSSREHIRLLNVLQEQYTPENSCLTRTMKPRRAAILSRYEEQVKALTDQLLV